MSYTKALRITHKQHLSATHVLDICKPPLKMTLILNSQSRNSPSIAAIVICSNSFVAVIVHTFCVSSVNAMPVLLM